MRQLPTPTAKPTAGEQTPDAASLLARAQTLAHSPAPATRTLARLLLRLGCETGGKRG